MIENEINIISIEKATNIIKQREPFGLFLVAYKDSYIAIDNTDGNVYTEEFDSEAEAKIFLATNISAEDIEICISLFQEFTE